MNKWVQFPHLTKGLSSVTLSYSGIDSAAMDRILRWIASFSANSLRKLEISHNNLTKIPRLLSSFIALKGLDMKRQAVPGLDRFPLELYGCHFLLLNYPFWI